MNKTILALLMLVSFSVEAFDLFGSQCRFPYRLQSFSFGAAEVFGSEFPEPEIVDNVCWKLGERYANRALDKAERDRDLDDCYDAYDEGVEQGLEATQSDMEMPTYCYNIGLQFGFMLLSEYARQGMENEVGDDCVEEYDEGHEAGLENRPPTVRSDNKLAHCYLTGYRDAQLF
tara:strand:+ start:887 stop:1408 length:522 start_codon:yes stop_codon:yes gene_type:complete